MEKWDGLGESWEGAPPPPPENVVSFDVFHPMDKAIVKGITKTYSFLLLIF